MPSPPGSWGRVPACSPRRRRRAPPERAAPRAACPCPDVSTSTDPAVIRFIQDYQAEFGSPPGPYAAEAWDAARALLAALTARAGRGGGGGGAPAAAVKSRGLGCPPPPVRAGYGPSFPARVGWSQGGCW